MITSFLSSYGSLQLLALRSMTTAFSNPTIMPCICPCQDSFISYTTGVVLTVLVVELYKASPDYSSTFANLSTVYEVAYWYTVVTVYLTISNTVLPKIISVPNGASYLNGKAYITVKEHLNWGSA